MGGPGGRRLRRVHLEDGASSGNRFGGYQTQRLGQHVLPTSVRVAPVTGREPAAQLDRMATEDDDVANRKQVSEMAHHDFGPERPRAMSQRSAEPRQVDLDAFRPSAGPPQSLGQEPDFDRHPIVSQDLGDARLARSGRPGESHTMSHELAENPTP